MCQTSLKRLVLFLAACAMALGPAVHATPLSEPARIVNDTSNRIIGLIDRNIDRYQKDPNSFYTVVEDTLAPHFDFELMSKLVIGTYYWGRSTPSQRNAFIKQFRDLLVRTYGAVFLKYRGEKISFVKSERLDEKGRVERVRSRVTHIDGRDDNFVDYVLVKRPSGWRVVDVAIDGVSIVTTYTETFKETIRRRRIDGLIEDLRKLNEAARQ